MLSQMLVGLPAGEMTPEDATSMKRAMALYGLGSVFKGDDASPTLQSMMMIDVARGKNAKEEAERQRIQSEIGSIWGSPMAQPSGTTAPAKNSYGLDMGRSSLPQGNTTTVGDKTYDMGRDVGGDYASAISTVESGGRYDAVGPVTKKGNRAYGKYQVMDFNVGPWTEKHLGRRMTPQEFLADPGAQDAVFNAEFGSYVNKYGNPQDAASAWFSGRPMSQAGNSSDGYTTVPEYVAKFNNALGQSSPAASRPAQSEDFSFGNLSGQQFQGALIPYLQQQQAQTQRQPGQGVRVAQNGTDWRQIALSIRNSNLPPEEKQRQFQQLRLMMQIDKAQQGDTMTGKERYMNVDGVLYDVSGDTPRPVTERSAKPSAADAKIDRIQKAYGVDFQTATGIADGVLRVSRDPYTDAIQVTNLATNEVWTPSARGEEQVEEQPASQQPELTFGNEYQAADASDAFGLEGMAKGTLNTVSDFVVGQEVFPSVGETGRDMSLLREELQQDLAAGYNRQPPSWALKAIRELIPAPGSFQGASSAQGQLRALGRKFETELQTAQQSLQSNIRGMSPEDRAKKQAEVSALKRSLAKINRALSQFGENEESNETSSGVKWRVVQ